MSPSADVFRHLCRRTYLPIEDAFKWTVRIEATKVRAEKKAREKDRKLKACLPMLPLLPFGMLQALINEVQQWPFLSILTVYAAVVSTTALVWDINKYYAGKASLRIKAQGGMKMGGSFSHFNISATEAMSLNYISISVTNIGDKTTTVTNIGLTVFSNRLMYWLNRPKVTYIISMAVKAMPLPQTLETGKPCTWVYEENEDVLKQAKGCLCFVTVAHSMSEKESYSQINWSSQTAERS